jgi:hypothetical protein
MDAELARATWYIEAGVLRWKVKRGRKVRAGDPAGSKIRNKKNIYCRVRFNGKAYFLHRLIWLITYGEFPSGQIDHIDGDGLNNSLENMRDVSSSENMRNQRLPSTNKSGRCGVVWHSSSLRWRASIYVDRKTIYLGYFDDFNDAVDAREDAERKYGYHANHGRTPVMEGER